MSAGLRRRTRLALCALVAQLLALSHFPAANAQVEGTSFQVPILVYHRFGPAVTDNMTVRTAVFESQLKYLRDNDYTVIPLRRLVDYYLGKAPPPAPRSVVITADDGHRTVFTEMLPLIRRYRIPVTLFVYPSAVSNATYAMTWEQLAKLKETGLFDIQSHSYWHPDFRKEKKRLAPAEYEKFVDVQLGKSKATLEKKLATKVDMLAWPFGICDDELMKRAVKAGYVAGFTLRRRHAKASDNVMALPRYLMTDGARGKAFARLLSGGSVGREAGY